MSAEERSGNQAVFQLVKIDGRWWITGIANDIETAGNPVPPALRN